MRHTSLTRREFTVLAAAGPLALGRRAVPAPAASEVIDRIRRQIGVDWKSETVDGVKAGDPSTPVTGIATTALATMAVLQQAARAGANLVVACEPTFYSRADAPTPAADPVVAAKRAFIADHRLVVFRLRDHWRARRPDPLAQGLGDALGWTTRQVAGDPSLYDIPASTLGALVNHTRQRLGARGGIRVIGAPETRVQKVALLPGSTPIAASLAALPGADVVIAGEVREWESTEYARDAIDSGSRKGLILVGRVVSEEAGMRLCADWLRTLVPEVSVRHIAAGDPYWRPA